MFAENDGYIVGLTGMSGAGKTTACEVFEKCGFGIVNCDLVSRIVVQKGKPALSELKKKFGEEVILPDGNLNRKALGNLIFSDETSRKTFNELIYPYISYEMIKTVKNYMDEGKSIILLDAPTLFESGTDDFCDAIVSVVADREVCIKRIMDRDSLTFEEAENRIKSQFLPEFYRKKSDYCVENLGQKEELIATLKSIAKEIISESDGDEHA